MTLDSSQYDRVHTILAGARRLGGAERAAFLMEACGSDVSLRGEVDELLAAGADDDAEDPFADESLAGGRRALEDLLGGAHSEWLPETIGEYRIIRRIGQGGMGVVYEAEQDSPRRRVAIKLLHPMHATPERLRRFRQEAELLGRLQHPGIAQIFEAGHYDVGRGPQPYFAMELVDGVDIRTHCVRQHLDRAARIELLARLADAVQYAHERDVIHRDLKPENVLVDAHGNPRILDFGIARARSSSATLSTVMTEEGQIVGTLAYMAPEQLRHSDEAVSARADVYALGVLGFELLVGRLPRLTDDLPLSEAIAHLATSEAPRAGTVDPELRGDVETILGKALEADRERRYPSAAALAGDLRRHLTHRPIHARPPSGIYLARKFVRRHKALVGGTIATLVVALAGAVVAGRFALEANRRAAAQERATYLSGIAAASSAVDQQNWTAVATHLERVPAAHRGWEYDYLRARLVHHSDEWEIPAPIVTAPVFDAAGERMVALLLDGSIATWDVATGALRSTRALEGIRFGDWPGSDVLLHGSRARFAAVSADGDIVIGDLESTEWLQVLPAAAAERPAPNFNQVHAWDAEGRRLLYSTGKLMVWDGVESTAILDTARQKGAFSPDGGRIAVNHPRYRGVLLVDAATGERLAESPIDDSIEDLAFAPDGTTLAVAGHTRNIYLLDGGTLEVQARLSGHKDLVDRVIWSPDGSRLISTSQDGTVRIWNLGRLGSVTSYTAGVTPLRPIGGGAVPAVQPTAALTPDGRGLVVAGHRLRRFPLEDPSVLRGHGTYAYFVTFSPDGSRLASGAYNDPEVLVWDLAHVDAPWRLPVNPGVFGTPLIGFSEDGRSVVVGGSLETLHRDVRTRAELPVSPRPNPIERFVETLGWQPWGPHGGKALSSNGRHFAICRWDVVELFEADFADRPTDTDKFPQDQLADVGALVGRLAGHVGQVNCVAFSPDGTRIATGGHDATVRLWDARTFEELLVLRGHEQYVMYVAFSADGAQLASASGDTTIRLWDTRPLVERRALARER